MLTAVLDAEVPFHSAMRSGATQQARCLRQCARLQEFSKVDAAMVDELKSVRDKGYSWTHGHSLLHHPVLSYSLVNPVEWGIGICCAIVRLTNGQTSSLCNCSLCFAICTMKSAF